MRLNLLPNRTKVALFPFADWVYLISRLKMIFHYRVGFQVSDHRAVKRMLIASVKCSIAQYQTAVQQFKLEEKQYGEQKNYGVIPA